jgi:plasmid stabilization system protein ParE
VIRLFEIIQPKALADLEPVHTFISSYSKPDADAAVNQLLGSVRSLKRLPIKYRPVQIRPKAAETVYGMVVPPYLIYYRVDESMAVVTVLTIRHSARRPLKRFPKC